MLRAARLTDAEMRLVAHRSRLRTASTASRLDAFLLPTRCTSPSTTPSRRPASATPSGCASCSTRLSRWPRFRASVARRAITGRSTRCSRRCSRATASGAARAAPPTMAIVDWREVPTWTEFEILRDAFVERRRADRRLRSARPGVRRRRAARPADGAIDLVYRRVLINDILAPAGRVPRAGRRLRGARRLRGEHVPLQASAQEGVLRGADRRAPRARCSRRPSARSIRAHVPWTRLVADAGPSSDGARGGLLELARSRSRAARAQAERRVRRHRRHARLGDDRARVGRGA